MDWEEPNEVDAPETPETPEKHETPKAADWAPEPKGNFKPKPSYSVDSIKRTVHLTFHGLFFLLKILFFWKLKTVFLIETVRKNKDAKIQAKKDLKGDPKGI